MENSPNNLNLYEKVDTKFNPVYAPEKTNFENELFDKTIFKKFSLNLFTYRNLEEIDKREAINQIFRHYKISKFDTLEELVEDFHEEYEDQNLNKEGPIYTINEYFERIEKGEGLLGDYVIFGKPLEKHGIDEKIEEYGEKMDLERRRYNNIIKNVLNSDVKINKVKTDPKKMPNKNSTKWPTPGEVNLYLLDVYESYGLSV